MKHERQCEMRFGTRRIANSAQEFQILLDLLVAQVLYRQIERGRERDSRTSQSVRNSIKRLFRHSPHNGSQTARFKAVLHCTETLLRIKCRRKERPSRERACLSSFFPLLFFLSPFHLDCVISMTRLKNSGVFNFPAEIARRASVVAR